MVISSFSCCIGTLWYSTTNLHGGNGLVHPSRSPDRKTVADMCAVGEGDFAMGAGLSGSGRDLCFMGLLAKQHAGE